MDVQWKMTRSELEGKEDAEDRVRWRQMNDWMDGSLEASATQCFQPL